MAWVYLLLAGLFEIGWPVGFKLSQQPEYKVTGIAIALVATVPELRRGGGVAAGSSSARNMDVRPGAARSLRMSMGLANSRGLRVRANTAPPATSAPISSPRTSMPPRPPPPFSARPPALEPGA